MILPIFGKSCRVICSSHRLMSLISVVPKLLASAILRNLFLFRELQCCKEQAGFRLTVAAGIRYQPSAYSLNVITFAKG